MASIMVLAGVSFNYRTPICFIENTMKSLDYTLTYTSHILPNIPRSWRSDWRLLQDNAPPHRALATKKYFDDMGVNCISFPPKSPDLNIIENVWNLLARQVYSDGKPKRDINELRQSIIQSWWILSPITINGLVDSMKDRLIAVIKSDGSSTKY